MKTVPKSISLKEARDIVRAHVMPLGVEVVPVTEAVGRVLAADVFSDIDVTPFDDSGMDGFAIRTSDLESASPENPVELCCVAHIGAGDVYDAILQPGEAVRIMTGACLCKGADAVVAIERVAYTGDGGIGEKIVFTAPATVGQNVRKAGDEAKAGDKVMEAGEVVRSAGVGLLAACGNLRVPVYKRPKVGIISIGSELMDAAEVPRRGMIRNSNVWAMQAYVVEAGGVPCVYPDCADDVDQILTTYKQAVAECDMVVSTGGACLGDFDLTGDVLRDLGVMHFERANMKPGKSQPFGEIDGKPVFVLSGNPAASSVGFELYVRLAMRIMQGYADLDRPIVNARITCGVRKKDGRLSLERGIFTQLEDGTLEVSPLKKQSSALYGALQKCNCLIVVPAGMDGLAAGDMASCIVTSADEGLPLRVRL